MLAKNTAGDNYLVKDSNVKKLHPLTKLLTFAPSVSDRAAEAAHVTPFRIGLFHDYQVSAAIYFRHGNEGNTGVSFGCKFPPVI